MSTPIKPDPELDYRMNSRGSMVIVVLRVKDVMIALRCSRSRAYEVIRECRGELVGSTLAFILPSQLQAWTLRQVGTAPELPMRAHRIVDRPVYETEFVALKQAARKVAAQKASTTNSTAPLTFTLPRTKAKKVGP